MPGMPTRGKRSRPASPLPVLDSNGSLGEEEAEERANDARTARLRRRTKATTTTTTATTTGTGHVNGAQIVEGQQSGGGSDSPKEVLQKASIVVRRQAPPPKETPYIWSSASMLDGLQQLKHWMRLHVNQLDVNKSDVSIDRRLMRPLLSVEQLSKHPAFWYAYLGSVVTQLTEACSSYLEVTANWLLYATVQTMNRQGGELLSVHALAEYINFLVAAVEMAEERVARNKKQQCLVPQPRSSRNKNNKNNNCNNDDEHVDSILYNGASNKTLFLKVATLVQGPKLVVTNENWILGDEREHSSLTLSYIPGIQYVNNLKMASSASSLAQLTKTRNSTADQSIELVHFSAPLKTNFISSMIASSFSSSEQEIEKENSLILEQTAMLYRRNATLALSICVTLVENVDQMVQLLKNSAIIHFLMHNLSLITKKASASNMAKDIPLDRLNTAILSLVVLFRAFNELKQSGGGHIDWDSLSWVNHDQITQQLKTLIESGGSGLKSTAASNTFAIFDRKVQQLHAYASEQRLLLLLQCLAEAVSRQLGWTDKVCRRNSAFKVSAEESAEDLGEQSSPVVVHPALSIGYFVYGTDDTKYQPYQWKCPFPLKPTSAPGHTKFYYAEVLLFTSGAMNIGFYFQSGDDYVAAEPTIYCAFANQNLPLKPMDKAPPAIVFYSPIKGELIVNGFSMQTNIEKTKLEQAKCDSQGKIETGINSIVLGVLLETCITSKPSISSASFPAPRSSTSFSPTVSLPSQNAAVTFFVNNVKVEAISKRHLQKAVENVETEVGNVEMEKYLKQFSGYNMAAFKRGDINNTQAAVFTLALANYQAAVLHRPQSSWNYEKDSKAAYNVGNWQEFPVMTKHLDIERAEMCHLLDFPVAAKLDELQFEKTFRSVKASYEIKKAIAEGSYGTVLQCIKKLTNDRKLRGTDSEASNADQVVIKVMECKDVFDLKAIKRELAFYTAFQTDKSQLFIKCMDKFSFSSIYTCLVFETMDISLCDYCAGTSVSLVKIKSIFLQLLKALMVLNKMKYIHGDIKPENVMMKKPKDEDTEVSLKLIDFGFSCCPSSKEMVYFKGLEPFDLNEIDTRLFTSGYASPEWLLDMDNQELTDLWATAVTIVETVIGDRLYILGHAENYFQLSAIWNFCRNDLPENAFYCRLNEDSQKFFTKEALKINKSSSSLSSSRKNSYRLKEPWELTGENEIPLSKRCESNGNKKLQGWSIATVEDVKPRRVTSQNIDLLQKLQDLLKQILVIDPAKRITVDKALKHSLFNA